MPLSDFTEPGTLNLRIVCGDSFTKTITVQESDGTAIDLTGITGRAEIRDRYGGSLLETFTVVIATPTNGQVAFSLTATQTRTLADGVWDIELDGGISNRHTILQGTVSVLPDVTVTP
jgi:hypothetical protein